MLDAISYHPSLTSYITWKFIKKKSLEISVKAYLFRCVILLHFNFLFFFLLFLG